MLCTSYLLNDWNELMNRQKVFSYLFFIVVLGGVHCGISIEHFDGQIYILIRKTENKK
jgi:hypothetical protein